MPLLGTYQFYLLPEHLHDFLSVLASNLGPNTESFHWQWPDGRSIAHHGEGEATPIAVTDDGPFYTGDGLDYLDSLTLMMPDDDCVRDLLGIPGAPRPLPPLVVPRWLQWLIRPKPEFEEIKPTAEYSPLHEIGGYTFSVKKGPLQLRWETGQPEYIYFELDGHSSSLSCFLGSKAFSGLVARLATQVPIQAGIFEIDGVYNPRFLDGQSINEQPYYINFPDVYCTPDRLREILPACTLHPKSEEGDELTQRAAVFCREFLIAKQVRQSKLSFEALRPWLQDESVLLRRLATCCMVDVYDLTADPYTEDLAMMLQDPSPRVRQMACETAYKGWNCYGTGDASLLIERLTKLLYDVDPGVRIMAGKALETQKINGFSAVKVLESDPHPQVRTAAVAIRDRYY